jgi:hypothetical protein
MSAVRLIDVVAPAFGVPATCPTLPSGTHARRFDAFRDRFRAAGCDAAVVYADREHAANLAWLAGFDPRFEEALLLLAPGRDPVILTGPENQALAAESPIAPTVLLHPSFGLLGQDRRATPRLDEVLRAHGLAGGQVIGVCGWKYFVPEEADAPETWIEIPAFIVDRLRAIAGPSGRVVNANALLMAPDVGLRATNEIAEIARFEFAAVHASEAVARVLRGFRPGMREHDGAALMALPGLPLSCHPMLSSGARAWQGLRSPSDKELARGDAVTCAVGLVGALSSRAGFMVEEAAEIAGAPDYVERLVAPYFACAAEWYETIGIGVPGGALDAVARRWLGDPFFGVTLNPGHLLSYDEWLSTPVAPGSTVAFRTGQAVQCDIIPATGTAWFTSNIEDGVALLDAAGREAFAATYPDAWARIVARRAFMADVLGIRLKPETLPLSNLAAALPPFWLRPDRVMARA